MSIKFDYLELMRRVDSLSKKASEDQLRIYRQKIINLYSYLPEKYTDYLNLLNNISLKWHPQKRDIFFMDSAYKSVNINKIENLLPKECPPPNIARNSQIIGSALIALGSCLALAMMAGLFVSSLLLIPAGLVPIMIAITFVVTPLVVTAAAVCIAYGVTKIETAANEYKLYETNEKLNETIASFEQDILSLDDVDNGNEGEQIDITSDPEDPEDSEDSEELTSKVRASTFRV